MIETSMLRSSLYYSRQDSPPASPSKPSGLHDPLSSTRSKAPVKLRKLEGERNMHTEIHLTPLHSPNSSIQAARLPNITQVERRVKRTSSNLNPSMTRESGKSRMDVRDEKVIHISKVMNTQLEDHSGSSPTRKARITLMPLEVKMKRNASGTNYDRNRSCLSPESLERIGEHLKQGSPVNKDIADVLEPIALKNSQKIKTVNKMFSEKDGGMGNSPKTKFEEEILDALKKRFVMDKLDTDIRVIRPMQSEKFTLTANKQAYFKLSTRNLRFPLQGRVLTKAPTSAYEIFASTKIAKPTLANCDQCFVGKEFFIEIQAKVEWIYFTLSASTDLEARIWILPEAGRRYEEETPIEPVVNNLVRGPSVEPLQPIPEIPKTKHSRLRSLASYSPEQINEIEEEVKQPKVEKEVRTRKLTRDEESIIVSNVEGIKSYNKEHIIERIQDFNKMKTEMRETLVKRRDRMVYEDRMLKKFLLNKRDHLKDYRKTLTQDINKEEIKQERRILWTGTVCQNLVLHSIAKTIWEIKANRLREKVRNRCALVIQRAYEKYIFRKGNNKILRKTVDIREALCLLTHAISRQATKKAEKVAKSFLMEFPQVQMIAIKARKFATSVRKIQKMAKRLCLLRRFQKLTLGMMIDDIVSQSTEEAPVEEIGQVKIENRVERVGRIKSKSVMEKGKFNLKDSISTAKQNKALRAQFDRAMLTSLEFRNIIIEAYLEEILNQKKHEFMEERRKQLYKLPQCKIQEMDEVDFCETLEDLNVDQSKETSCTLVKTNSIVSQGSRHPIFSKESSLFDSKLTASLKLGASSVNLKAISKDGLITFLDENYMQIAKKAKAEGYSKLLWLFN